MSSFKVGDRVRAVSQSCGWGYVEKGDVGTISRVNIGSRWGYQVDFPRHSSWSASEGDLELINGNEGEKVSRRTFKLLKDTVGVRKGALYQEECEDGTQPYSIITPEFAKSTATGTKARYADRALIEEQPQWFVEVFKVEPAYMTKEELEKWEAFQKFNAKAKPGPKSGAKKKKYVGKYTGAQRSAHMKAYWARRKAAERGE